MTIKRIVERKYVELRCHLEYYRLSYTAILLVLAGFIFIYLLNIPDRHRIEEQEALMGVAYGTVESIEAYRGYTQGFDGAHEITISYEVAYVFMVERKYYNDINVIQNFHDIDYTKDGYLIIKYMIGYPEKSLIQLKK